MSFKVSTSHIQYAFSDPERASQVLEQFNDPAERPDVAFFVEAWPEGDDRLAADIKDQFLAIGYQPVCCLYEDDDTREDRHAMMAVVRNNILADRLPDTVRLGSRNALYVPFADPDDGGETKDIYFVHLDDRDESRRLGQVNVLLDEVIDPDRPTIIGGKFNALYTRDPLAVALRVQRPIANRLPAVDPGPHSHPNRIERVGSLGQRLGSMASGTVMRRVTAAGFKDADPHHRATKGPFNLDRFVYRGIGTAVHVLKNRPLFKDQRSVTAVF